MTLPPNPALQLNFRSRSHDAVIRVYDAAGNVIVFQRPVGTMMRPGGFLVRCFT